MPKIDVNPNFAGSGRRVRRRKRYRTLRRVAAIGAVCVLAVALIAGSVKLVGALWSGGDVVDQAGLLDSDEDDLTLVQSEDAGQGGIELQAAAAEAFLDIRGAPMIINLPEGPGMGARRVLLDVQIDPNRARQGDEIRILEDTLFDATQRVQLTLPSSSADLAAFQARRETAITSVVPDRPSADLDDAPVAAGEEITVDASDGSWGEILGDDAQATTETVSYVETVIENTTTEVLAMSSNLRTPLFRDAVVRLETEKSLKDTLLAEGISADEVDRAVNATVRQAGELGQPPETFTDLPKGGLVALRFDTSRADAQILQMSVYDAERYLISLAQPGPGRFERSADPWFADDLLRKAGRALRARGAQGEVKLKDAVYSTALRNGLPSELVGELMVMLSRVQDLSRIATEQDRMMLILGADGRNTAPAGQILYVSLTGPDIDFTCFVLRPQGDNLPYGCYDPSVQGPGSSGAVGSLGGGFLIPVAGTKTSSFGPRHHPILKKTVSHNGVDWAAPTGTPVTAVAAGRISRADMSSSYGNIIYIDHDAGVQSRYAHLNEFAAGIKQGDTVDAGQLIGYVGTTGRSTGPHLHFELHISGRPVDPLALGVAKASGAVEALVAQIIRVESAGNARAKNTRSSATGLGQFINSTWLRMMRTYRPDLVAQLSESELLDLRFDPDLSRAMVTNLARENEAFLRARGHDITPGRLYLAHFLGPAGANTALSANPAASVLEVMGAGVVSANPFLTGWTVAQMAAWSDRKMGRVSGGDVASAATAPPAPRVEPEEVKRYKAGIEALLATL